MSWIKTIPLHKAEGRLREVIEGQRKIYPEEYNHPVEATRGVSIVESHSLIPEALHHAFRAFGVLMAEDLPLNRAQHEMIATLVSVTNHCHY